MTRGRPLAPLPFLLIALASLHYRACAQEVPDWVTQYSTYARQDPLGFVSLLANMPVEQQSTFLMLIGAALQERQNLVCNPLGGTEACMTLSADSHFAQSCPGHDLKVDCAYYSDDLQEVNLDPSKELRQLLRLHGMQGLESACPQCFTNQQKLWCAQTVPACGSYQQHLLALILPALAQVVSAQQMGQSQNEAISLVMPQLLQAGSLSLPCREMCEAVISTCSCGRERTLGSLLDGVVSGLLPDEQLPHDFSQQIFGSLYDQPLCSLYVPSSTEGFTGTCEVLDQQCSSNSTWCHDGSNPDLDAVEQMMALQLTKGLFGWIGNHSTGLFAEEQEAIEDADAPGEKAVEDEYIHGPGEIHHHVLAAVLGVAAAAVSAAVVFALVASYRPDALSNLPNLRQLFSRRTATNDQEYLELEATEHQEPLVVASGATQAS